MEGTFLADKFYNWYHYNYVIRKILNPNKIILTFLRWLLKLYHNFLIPHFHIEKTIRITYLWANTVGKGNKKYRGKIISFHISCKKFLPPLPLAFLIYCFSHIAGQYTACWVTFGDISPILRDLFSHKYWVLLKLLHTGNYTAME